MLVGILVCAITGAFVVAGVFAAPSRRAHQMKFACAWTESGLLRYAARRSDCDRRTETPVSIADEAPVYACVSGRYMLSRRAGQHPRGTVIPLGTMWRAPRAGYCRLLHQREIALGGAVLVHLCAAQDGLLRYVHAASRCHGGERELFVPARSHRHPRRDRPPHLLPVRVPPKPPSNPPTAYPQTLSDDEGAPLAITLSGATDPPGKSVGYEIVSAPAHGALTGVPPSVTYTPAAGYHGPDSFTFRVSDGTLTSAPATVSITVNHVDVAPINTVPAGQSVHEEASLVFSSVTKNAISMSDSDSEGGVEQAVLEVAHGSLQLGTTSGLEVLIGNGSSKVTARGTVEALDQALEGLTYTPAAGYHGLDTLSLESDDLGHSGVGGPRLAAGSVQITVVQVDRPPVNSVPGAQSLAENGSLAFSSLGANQISVSDSDSEGGVERVKLSVAHGSLSPGGTSGLSAHSGDGTGTLTLEGTVEALGGALEGLVYTPAHDFYGSDSLSVETDDLGHTGLGGPLTDVSSVPIAVSVVSYDTAVPDSYSTSQNVTLSAPAGSGVLANDSDADTPPLPLKAEVVSGPAHGALTLNPDGSFEYVPAHDFSGTDSFTYRDNDGNTQSNVATVTLTVNKATYDTAVNDSYSLHESTTLNESAAEGLLANDTDSDVPPLALEVQEVVTSPAHGTLTWSKDGSFTYTPDASYHGADSFTYRDTDGNTPSNIATVSLNVEQVDRAPVNSVPGEQSLAENGVLTFSSLHANQISVSDSDSEGGVEQVKLAVTHGTLALGSASGLESVVGNESSQVTARGTIASLDEALEGLVYTPAHDFYGSDSLSVETDDLGHTGVGGPLTDVSSVPIAVSVVAYDTAVADSYTMTENETLSKTASSGVLANDTESDTPTLPLEAVLVAGPSHGTLTLKADGSFEYTPAHNYAGSDSFTYKDYDTNTYSNTVTVTLTVERVAYDKAVADSYSLNENEMLSKGASAGVLANDTDSQSLPLEAVLVSTTSHGTLKLESNGEFTYVPNHDFHGTDSFTYEDYDTNTYSNTVTVTLTVEPVAYDTAVADTYTTNENETLSKSASSGVLANDTESDSPALPLTAVLVSGPAHGTLKLESNGEFEYVPTHNFHGTDSFTYKDNDTNTDSNTVTVTLTVEPVVYDTAVADSYTAHENEALSKTGIEGVLANDTESDSPALPLTAVLVSGPSHGTLKLESNGEFEYVPAHDFHGTDSFTYKDNDGNTDSNTVTVTLTVEPVVYDTAVADSYAAHENEMLSVSASTGVLANDTESDTPALPLEAVLVSGPSHGTLTLKSDGSFEYTPTHNYAGSDSFTYKDNDTNTDSNTVTVTLTVERVAFDKAVADSYTTNENETLSKGASSGVLANDTDSQSLPLEAMLVSTTSHGTLKLEANGEFTYVPDHNFQGTDSFTYKDYDTNTYSNTVTVTLTVEPVVYDTAVADSYTAHENETLSKTGIEGVLANDTESDSPALPLTAVLVSGPSHGTLKLESNGEFEYVPAHDFHGTDSFTYKDNDGNTDSNTVTVTLTVEPVVYDTAVADSYAAHENEALSVSASTGVLANDTESDTPALPLEAVLVSGPSHGTLTLKSDGSFEYTPTHNYAGSDSFTYKDNDTNTDSNTVTVTLTVEATVYDKAVADNYTAPEDTTLSVPASTGVLANDTDADTPPLTLKAVLVKTTEHGTLKLNEDGSFEYTPTSGFHGADSFMYKDNDGNTESNTATVTIEVVQHTNEAPALSAPSEAKVIENLSGAKTTLVFSKANSNQIAMSDKDAEGGAEKLELAVSHGTLTPHSATGLTVVGSGTASLTLEGTLTAIGEGLEGLTYTPTLEYTGSDTLALTANDLGHSGSGGSKTASASVSITVTAPNPTPINPTFTGAIGNTELSVGVARSAAPDVEKTGSVLPSPAEGPDKSSVAVTAETIETEHKGSVSMNANGTFTYQPPVGLHTGTDKFNYNETDSLGGKATGTATIEFNGHRVWYVKSQEAEAGTGASNKPFKSLSSVETASASGDTIFLENSSAAYSGGITLKPEQALDGQYKELKVAEEEIMPASGVYPIVEKPGFAVVTVQSEDTVNGVEVKSAEEDGIFGTGLSGEVTISNDAILGNKTSSKGSGIDLLPATTGTLLTLDIAHNTISGQHVWGINLLSEPGAHVDGTIAHNTIGEAGVEGSGSQDGGGMDIYAAGKSNTTTVEISENTVQSIGHEGMGMRLESKENATSKSFGAVLNATVLNNTIEMNSLGSSEGLYVEAGNEGSPNSETLCLNAKGNTIKATGKEPPEGSATFNAYAVLLDVQAASTFEVQGAKATPSNAEVEKLLEAENKLTSAVPGEPIVFTAESRKPFSTGTCPAP